MDQFALQAFQELVLGLAGSQAGDALQLADLALFDLFGFLPLGFRLAELFLNGLLFLFQVVDLAVQGFLFLLDAAFLAGNLGAAVLDVPVRFGAELVDLFLGFDEQLFFLGFGGAVGFVDDLLRLVLRAADFRFRDPFPVSDADEEGDDAAYE